MGIFSKKNNNTLEPFFDSQAFADSSNNALIANAADNYAGGSGVNYVNPEKQTILEGAVDKSKYLDQPEKTVSEGIWLMDIAQSHHYTVHISGMKMSALRLPNGAYSEFLPVKNMSVKYTSYENMSIPVAIFGDFPLLNKKRVSTIDLSCFDYDNNKLEYELRQWEAMCFPKGRFVAYMEDIAREFVYRGYSVEGKQTLEYRIYVIPAGNVSVSRDYSANDAKMVNFSLVCVGDGRTCATGDGKVPVVVHGGGGDGRGSNGPYHDAYATGLGQWDPKTQQMKESISYEI